MTAAMMRKEELLLMGSPACSCAPPGKSRSFHKTIARAVLRTLQRHSKHGDHSYKQLLQDKDSGSSSSSHVPKGYFAVYVGEQQQKQQRGGSGEEDEGAVRRERFLVRTEHLRHPIFKVLLKRSEEEFRFCQKGALLIPCKAAVFQLLLCHIENDDMALDAEQAEELVKLYLFSLPDLQNQ